MVKVKFFVPWFNMDPFVDTKNTIGIVTIFTNTVKLFWINPDLDREQQPDLKFQVNWFN